MSNEYIDRVQDDDILNVVVMLLSVSVNVQSGLRSCTLNSVQVGRTFVPSEMVCSIE